MQTSAKVYSGGLKKHSMNNLVPLQKQQNNAKKKLSAARWRRLNEFLQLRRTPGHTPSTLTIYTAVICSLITLHSWKMAFSAVHTWHFFFIFSLVGLSFACFALVWRPCLVFDDRASLRRLGWNFKSDPHAFPHIKHVEVSSGGGHSDPVFGDNLLSERWNGDGGRERGVTVLSDFLGKWTADAKWTRNSSLKQIHTIRLI